MTAVSEFASDIIADIPEIPVFVASRQVLRACRVLCERARVWRYDISLNTTASQATYDLSSLYTPEANVELVDIISMKPTDGRSPVVPVTKGWMDKNEADWRDQEALVATWFTLESNDTIRLIPTPSQTVTDAYDVRIAVKPKLDATTVDDIIYNKFYETVIAGAKSFLFLIPRKPWSDPNLAQFHLAMFNNGVIDAVPEASDDFQTGVPRKVKYGGI